MGAGRANYNINNINNNNSSNSSLRTMVPKNSSLGRFKYRPNNNNNKRRGINKDTNHCSGAIVATAERARTPDSLPFSLPESPQRKVYNNNERYQEPYDIVYNGGSTSASGTAYNDINNQARDYLPMTPQSNFRDSTSFDYQQHNPYKTPPFKYTKFNNYTPQTHHSIQTTSSTGGTSSLEEDVYAQKLAKLADSLSKPNVTTTTGVTTPYASNSIVYENANDVALAAAHIFEDEDEEVEPRNHANVDLLENWEHSH